MFFIRNLWYPHLTPVIILHNNRCDISTSTHKFEWLMCTETQVLWTRLSKIQIYVSTLLLLYILASDFFKKTINTYLKLEIRVMCRKLAFKYVFIDFLKQIRWSFIFVLQRSSKLAFKTGFSTHNIHLYLCWQAENA